MHGHPADLRVERRAFGTAQLDQDASDLEPEVVVEPGRAMPLDDETPTAAAGLGVGRAGCRFRGLPEVALAAVFLEGHSGECAR